MRVKEKESWNKKIGTKKKLHALETVQLGGGGRAEQFPSLIKRRGFSGKTGITELMNILDVQWLYISNGYQNIFLLNNFL